MALELSILQKLRLKIFGRVPIGTKKKKGWRAPIKHYAFKCSRHGTVVDYPHGFRRELHCPKCTKEMLRERERRK